MHVHSSILIVVLTLSKRRLNSLPYNLYESFSEGSPAVVTEFFPKMVQSHASLSSHLRSLEDFSNALSQTFLLHLDILDRKRKCIFSVGRLFHHQLSTSVKHTHYSRPLYLSQVSPQYTARMYIIYIQYSFSHLSYRIVVQSQPIGHRFSLHHHNLSQNCSFYH